MIKPVADRVLLKIEKREDTTKSGIILSSSDNEKTQTAKVIEVGTGDVVDEKNVEIYIKANQRVIVNKYAGTEIKYDGEEYLIVKQDDVLAIVE